MLFFLVVENVLAVHDTRKAVVVTFALSPDARMPHGKIMHNQTTVHKNNYK